MVSRWTAGDDFPDEDRAIVGGSGHAVILPRSAARLGPEAIELLSEIQGLSLDQIELETKLRDLTLIGRDMGISWSVLAATQGLTAEGLRRRHVELGEPE